MKNQPNEYPVNWKEIAEAVRRQANYRCVRCGHPNDVRGDIPCDKGCKLEYHESDGKQRVLTVHHIDMNKANCKWWNLAALCQICHLQIQHKLNVNQMWWTSHSLWFKPYLAGFLVNWVVNHDDNPIKEFPGYGTVHINDEVLTW